MREGERETSLSHTSVFSIAFSLLFSQGGYLHNLSFSYSTLSTHLGTSTWCFTRFTVICGDWFARPVIFTWKIWKVYPRCYWATPESRKLLSVFPPCSTLAYTASVELMCLEIHGGGFSSPVLNLTIEVIMPVQEVVQNIFFQQLVGKRLILKHNRLWFAKKVTCCWVL